MYPSLHLRGLSDLETRMDYYSTILGELSGINPNFNRGEFQYGQDYWQDLRELLKHSSIKRTAKALPEEANRSLDHLLVVSQVLDGVYLDKDFIIAGVPQRMVYMLGRDILPEKDKKPLLFFRLAKDIQDRRLKQSSTSTRINIHDSHTTVEDKLNKMNPDQIERVYKYSVKPYFDNPGDQVVEDMADKLSHRFRDMEERLEKEGDMSWLDKEKFS